MWWRLRESNKGAVCFLYSLFFKIYIQQINQFGGVLLADHNGNTQLMGKRAREKARSRRTLGAAGENNLSTPFQPSRVAESVRFQPSLFHQHINIGGLST